MTPFEQKTLYYVLSEAEWWIHKYTKPLTHVQKEHYRTLCDNIALITRMLEALGEKPHL